MTSEDPGVTQVGLIALFVTALVTAQVTAAKLLAFELPVALPVTGAQLVLPGAALAYALTFFASDCYAELYGERAARVVVNVAFGMNVVVLVLVWSTIAAPTFQFSPVSAADFRSVLGPSTGVVAGSLLAYLVSQHWDVWVFHRLSEYTDGEHLWARNLGSTATSQALDTVIFITVAFLVVPTVLGGDPQSLSALAALIVGQYVFKLLVAVVDTPFVYLVVGAARSDDGQRGALGAK
jgi:uncharacterized integral membrane protein (TIGR00697 family)